MNILDIAKEAGAYHADKTIDSVLESGAIAFANKAQLTKFAELLLAGQWQPIEIYDAMKVKPDLCVFYVAKYIPEKGKHSGNYLSETYSLSRTMGRRNITMFYALPQPPKE